ncbi:RNA-binding domain-containing protein [Lentinus tigrinus ALCF2SS1-7]|uniref:Probable RNA-binding protein 18 n=1 Tax=Lentinus tigrinus ALCF2SS1-6 TaxID=1328759 RepID=A0A5C2SPV4_9APHY|nr:RNA-binding domain-containing protein [Lentinus tigrinus ALCF2SS1-6]RPD79222.1 RNA-binding domain-containing protein [Lentinus tigrinus ALCF2SS1-7]
MASSPIERSPPATSSEQATPNIASESLSEHLSYPTLAEPAAPVASSSTATQARPLLKDRLYVGNLHPSVDEYTLLQVFSKFGKISKLDYLFHKSGPLRGKPRGYAFVEYGSKDDAERALTHAHDKLLRGRKLVVTYANQAPLDSASGAFGTGSKNRRPMSEVGKPTTLSLLKSAGTGRANATDAKIARMEAKLRQLEGASTASAVGSLPGHPSLPPKPVAAAAATTSSPRLTPTHATPGAAPAARERRHAPPLPSLPIIPSTHPPNKVEKGLPLVSSASPPIRPSNKKHSLSGIRIVKKNPGSTG